MKRQIGQIGWSSFTKLFMSLVLPSMMYGCEVWGLMGRNNKKLERVQLTAIRNFLGVHSRFPITALELEAGFDIVHGLRLLVVHGLRLLVVHGLRLLVVHGLRLLVVHGLRLLVVHGLRLLVVYGLRLLVVHGLRLLIVYGLRLLVVHGLRLLVVHGLSHEFSEVRP